MDYKQLSLSIGLLFLVLLPASCAPIRMRQAEEYYNQDTPLINLK